MGDHALCLLTGSKDAEADVCVVDEGRYLIEGYKGLECDILQFPFRCEHTHLRIGLTSANEREVYGSLLSLECGCSFQNHIDSLQRDIASVKEHFASMSLHVFVVRIRAKSFGGLKVQHSDIGWVQSECTGKELLMGLGIYEDLIHEMAIYEVEEPDSPSRRISRVDLSSITHESIVCGDEGIENESLAGEAREDPG